MQQIDSPVSGSSPEAVIQSLPYPAFAVDSDGTVSYVSDSCCSLFGASRDSLIGNDWEAMKDATSSEHTALAEAITSVCTQENESSATDRVPVVFDNGQTRQRYTARVNALTENGTCTGALVLFEEHNPVTNDTCPRGDRRFYHAFERHSAPMLLIDPETGLIENANAAAVEFYGYSRDTLTTMPIQAINCRSDEAVAKERERAQEENRTHFRFEHELASGEVRPVEVYSSPVELDGGELLFSIIHDITERRRHEKALERERAFSANVLNTLDDIFYIIDERGRLQRWNDPLETVSGYDGDELSGKSITTLIAGDQQSHLADVIASVLDGKAPITYEVKLKTKAGELIPYEFTATPLPDERRSLAVAGIGRDITERKQRERNLKQLRRGIEATPHAIFITDSDGTIEYVNPAFEAMTGYAEADVLGENPRLFQSGEHDEDYYRDLWKTITAGDVWRARVINQRQSGERYHADQTIAPITEDGEVTAFVAIQTDVTGREERQQHFRVLSRVLRHNLQNDLSVITSYTEQIREAGTHEQETEKIMKKTDDILQTARKERDIAAVLAEDVRRRECDAVELVERACTDVRTNYPDATIKTDLPDSVTVIATERLRAALVELMENAIVHSDESVEITVSVTMIDDHVSITVSDTGPGIPESEQKMLETGTEIDQLYHGSGLGLWLVYWLVRQSGGTLEFAENDPQGSIVTICLQRDRTVETTGYVVEQ